MDRLPPRRAGQINFWEQLSDLERKTLARVGTQRSVYAGDTVPVRDIAITMAGSWVRLQAGNARTSRSIIDLAAPGDLVGALHPTEPWWLGEMADIYGVALTRGTILDVAQEMIPIVLGDLPHIQTLIRRIQNDQLHFARQLQAGRRLKIDVRLARLLLSLLHRFGERAVFNRNVLAPPLSQGDLAAWIGASETSVGRVLRQWRRDGLVSIGYSWISITDHKVLRAIADSPAMPYARFLTTSGFTGLDVTTDLPPGLHARGSAGHGRSRGRRHGDR